MPAQPAREEPDRTREPLENPELELMARLDEELAAYGPMTRGQVARTLERVVKAAHAPGLTADRRARALRWALDAAEEAERAERRARDAEAAGHAGRGPTPPPATPLPVVPPEEAPHAD